MPEAHRPNAALQLGHMLVATKGGTHIWPGGGTHSILWSSRWEKFYHVTPEARPPFKELQGPHEASLIYWTDGRILYL